jgi:antibiotic biosynthesis monooxygenase (ABM) superfamily enzyme
LGGREKETLGLVMGDSAMVFRGLALSARAALRPGLARLEGVYTVWRFWGKFCAARQGLFVRPQCAGFGSSIGTICYTYSVYPGRLKLYAGWLRRKEEKKPAP